MIDGAFTEREIIELLKGDCTTPPPSSCHEKDKRQDGKKNDLDNKSEKLDEKD